MRVSPSRLSSSMEHPEISEVRPILLSPAAASPSNAENRPTSVLRASGDQGLASHPESVAASAEG